MLFFGRNSSQFSKAIILNVTAKIDF